MEWYSLSTDLVAPGLDLRTKPWSNLGTTAANAKISTRWKRIRNLSGMEEHMFSNAQE